MDKIFKKSIIIQWILMVCLSFNGNLLAREDVLDFDIKVKQWAESCNHEVTALFEGLLNSNILMMPQLFDTFYIPIPDTEPPKYSTQYDKILEAPLQKICDNYLNKNEKLVYVMAVDAYGYLPAANSKFSKLPTGNREDDLKNSRVKRILNDRIGRNASKNKEPYLVQQYALDTGEEIVDFSIPIFIRDRHWGAIRIGYKKN
jgi:hypothetical protein